jgi:histone deacetylase 1/2
VQIQDVPRESLGEHLGYVRPEEDEAYDELDEQIARMSFITFSLPLLLSHIIEHSRLLYKMQDSSSDSDGDSDLSAASRSRRSRGHISRRPPPVAKSGKKRMSILTNQYVELPPDEEYTDFAGFDPHRPSIRRFFGAVDVPTWDEREREGEREKVEKDEEVASTGVLDRSVAEDGSDEEMDAEDV